MNNKGSHNNPLSFYVASYDGRNVAIKRDADYQNTINLIKKSYSTLRSAKPQNIHISTTLPEQNQSNTTL
ncbi:hypothetical protein BDV93DRAFT_528990 [Ceratobasidium sp. AG-I]|nr:hypothetical protein BDV93DRAFT_528990 [Ceratobasidium sp. AG-I]